MKTPSRLLSAWLLASAPAASFLVTPASAQAQSTPQVTSSASADEVEVGEPFTIELKALSETQESVSSPDLRAPGFSVSGPMISTQTYMQFGTGGRKTMTGIGATWSLVPSAPGNFTIPAPTVLWNGQRLKGSPHTIKVVPQGTRPRRQPGGFLFPGGLPNSPFGGGWPFGGMGQGDADADADAAPDDAALNLPRAANNDVFLHAIADKKKAVVGEQVTISVYRYFSRAAYSDITERTPMRLEDFLRFSLIGDTGVQTTSTARAGDKRFFVRLIEKYGVIPLRTGTLRTGSMMESYVPWSRRGAFRRVSEDLSIEVTEPPAAKRPVGYRLGDVGQFQISALVQPRRVEEGGSVAVTVKVTGSGNFPASLPVPAKTGVEWLDPEKKESIEPRSGELSGYRSFGYVVRLTGKGAVDLGTIELPYWNPRAKRYEVARSALGTVDVLPGAAPAPSGSAAPAAPDKDEPFANLPPARTALSPYARPVEGALLQGPRFAFALAAPPLAALLGIGGVELTRRARARLAGRKTSPATLAAQALDDARRADAMGDRHAATAAAERAIVLAIEAATGLKARGVLKHELAAELLAAGVPAAVAQRAQDMLATCDEARFDPLAAAGVSLAEARSLVDDLLGAKAP